MDGWFDPPQLFGYAGTACFLFNAALIALHQKTSLLYWAVTWLGNVAWLTAGILMGQPAVVLDVLVFLPTHVLGCWRSWRREGNLNPWAQWTSPPASSSSSSTPASADSGT